MRKTKGEGRGTSAKKKLSRHLIENSLHAIYIPDFFIRPGKRRFQRVWIGAEGRAYNLLAAQITKTFV